MKKAYFTFIFSLLFLACNESDYSEDVTNHYVSNIADLNQFAAEILKYEKINSMSFGDQGSRPNSGYHESVNPQLQL